MPELLACSLSYQKIREIPVFQGHFQIIPTVIHFTGPSVSGLQSLQFDHILLLPKLETVRMAHLSRTVVEAVEALHSGQIFLRDDAIKGFALRVLAAGGKSFIWEGWVLSRMRRITVGRYPDLPVLLARQKALEIGATVGLGGDPYRQTAGCPQRAEFRRSIISLPGAAFKTSQNGRGALPTMNTTFPSTSRSRRSDAG